MSVVSSSGLVICFGSNWFPIRVPRGEAGVFAKRIHDDWYAGNQSFIVAAEDNGFQTFINLKALVGVYTREVGDTHERQIKALEKIADAASDGDSWKKGDDE